MFHSDSKFGNFLLLRKYFLQTRMKISLVKTNIDADIFSSDKLEKDWLGKISDQNRIKNGILLFFFF